MSWREIVRAHYPEARPVGQARDRLLQWLESERGGDRETTLLAVSTCSDDIIATKDLTRDLWGPFLLGGLGGFPFAGRTGMTAFAHHVPDGGTGLVLYGPHVGVTREGVLGQVRRHAQSRETATCGALMAALDRLRDTSPAPPGAEARDDDLQQVQLERSLEPYRERILGAGSPVREITEVAYALIHRQVQDLLGKARTEPRAPCLVSVGAVIIHTGPDDEDWVDLREIDGP